MKKYIYLLLFVFGFGINDGWANTPLSQNKIWAALGPEQKIKLKNITAYFMKHYGQIICKCELEKDRKSCENVIYQNPRMLNTFGNYYLSKDPYISLQLYKKSCKLGYTHSCDSIKFLTKSIEKLKNNNPPWMKDLYRFFPTSLSSTIGVQNPLDTVNPIFTRDFGPFSIMWQGDNSPIITGPFKIGFNRQIAEIIKKRGISINTDLDFTTALILYIHNHTYFTCNMGSKHKPYKPCTKEERIAHICWALINASNNMEVGLINNIINDFSSYISKKNN